MFKQFLFFMLFIILCSGITAQKGINSLSLNGEAGIPAFQNDNGYGIFLKGAYGTANPGK